MPRILVTGGAGYVGSHCCKAFAQAGWDVTVFDNLSNGWRDFVKWGGLIEGDLRDPEAINAAVIRTQPDAIAHFAGTIEVGVTVANPGLAYRNNVIGTLNLLEAMVENEVRSLVFSSTCAVYGEPQFLPLTEDHPRAPVNPYGWSKLACEQMIEDFGNAHGLRSYRLRYFNAAGASRDGEIGERHDPETHLIPLVIDATLDTAKSISVFGEDYDTPDGTAIRDYIHVEDLASAHQLAVAQLHEGGTGGAVNLGMGTGVSVAEVIDAVERAAGHRPKVIKAARRAGDASVLVADPAEARRVLNWSARSSDIDTIVSSALGWHRKSA